MIHLSLTNWMYKSLIPHVCLLHLSLPLSLFLSQFLTLSLFLSIYITLYLSLFYSVFLSLYLFHSFFYQIIHSFVSSHIPSLAISSCVWHQVNNYRVLCSWRHTPNAGAGPSGLGGQNLGLGSTVSCR